MGRMALHIAYTVGCSIGFGVQTVFNCQYHMCWLAEKHHHDTGLAPENLHKTPNMKPILQRIVAQPEYGSTANLVLSSQNLHRVEADAPQAFGELYHRDDLAK
jgi:hypothetical protein